VEARLERKARADGVDARLRLAEAEGHKLLSLAEAALAGTKEAPHPMMLLSLKIPLAGVLWL